MKTEIRDEQVSDQMGKYLQSRGSDEGYDRKEEKEEGVNTGKCDKGTNYAVHGALLFPAKKLIGSVLATCVKTIS